mmetsp:Transcript_94508/g.282175  ORF Transcript_94508/g.282175 Transcript_94508/m.282175 type:complete len:248 (-) Transcript_94508:586-1329(-)
MRAHACMRPPRAHRPASESPGTEAGIDGSKASVSLELLLLSELGHPPSPWGNSWAPLALPLRMLSPLPMAGTPGGMVPPLATTGKPNFGTEGLPLAPAGDTLSEETRLEVPLGSAFSITETGKEGGGLAYFGGSASTSKALKSCRARLLATASLRKLRQSNRCSQVSMCTVESSASGTSSSSSRSAASTTSLRQRNGTPARPRPPAGPAAASPPPAPPRCAEPEEATQKGSLAVQRLGTEMLVKGGR